MKRFKTFVDSYINQIIKFDLIWIITVFFVILRLASHWGHRRVASQRDFKNYRQKKTHFQIESGRIHCSRENWEHLHEVAVCRTSFRARRKLEGLALIFLWALRAVYIIFFLYFSHIFLRVVLWWVKKFTWKFTEHKNIYMLVSYRL